MSKRFQVYKQNILKQEHFFLDVINLVLGMAIIVLTVFAFFGDGSAYIHALIFFLGGILMLLNTIKNVRRKSLLGVSFAIFTVLMFGIFAYIFYFYILAG